MYKRIFEAGSYLQVYFTMYKTIRTVRVLQGGTIVKEQIKSLVMAISASFLGVSIILFPEQSFEASFRGIQLWIEVVFPSLLPFFIVAELLMAFGVVKFIGVLLEPMMCPLFNVPGTGGVVLGMGLASGYPAGTKITSQLRKENAISKTEGERLISFTNASNPLFIFGAVSIGFFQNAKVGLLLAVSHYLGSILVGLCMRFYKKNERSTVNAVGKTKKEGLLIKRAWSELHTHRLEHKQTLGHVLGRAVTSAIQTLCMIGGFIVLFSVLNQILYLTGITVQLADLLNTMLYSFEDLKQFTLPIVSSIFEVTIGSQLITQTEHTTILAQLIVVSGVLAFNGLSIHAQIASIVAETDLRFAPYFFARFLHILFATTLTFILYKPLYVNRFSESTNELPVMQTEPNPSWFSQFYEQFTQLGPIFTVLTLITFCLYMMIQIKKSHSR